MRLNIAMAKKDDAPVNELDVLISENIKAILKERGLKKTPFSIAAGFEQGHFSELINNKKRWNSDNILKVANALALQPYEILANQRETALLRAIKQQIGFQIEGNQIKEAIAKEKSSRKQGKT